jgi:hypothetical protein
MQQAIEQAIALLSSAHVATNKVWERNECVEGLKRALQSMQGEADNYAIVEADMGCLTYEVHAYAELEEGQKLYTHPQSPAVEWIEGAPQIGHSAILHIPLRGYPDFCVVGCIDDIGSVVDMCGDDLGSTAADVERWTELPAMLTAAQEPKP